jgi:hypothetical protein
MTCPSRLSRRFWRRHSPLVYSTDGKNSASDPSRRSRLDRELGYCHRDGRTRASRGSTSATRSTPTTPSSRRRPGARPGPCPVALARGESVMKR